MKKRKLWKVLAAAIALIVLVLVGIYFLLQRQSYSEVEVVKYYENVSSDNPGYIQYLDGILKYTRDGVSFLNKSGEEIWNQPCQMGNPVVTVREEIVVLYDRSGTSVLVLQEEGLKGEIKTTRPIERVDVSAQGIVAAVLKDDQVPMIVCYDATGNILVQQSASLDNTGYPIDVAISDDGTTLLVSYLLAEAKGIRTKIVLYDFGDENIDKKDHKVFEKEYENVIIPLASYLDKTKMLLVADDSFIIYEGKEQPEEIVRTSVEAICNVVYEENKIAMIVRNAETSMCELEIYGLNGEKESEILLEREYSNIKICNGQIILYEGKECCIYTKDGVCKYRGEMDMDILEMFPLAGLNKYMMINANGFYEVRLAKLGE